MGGAVAGIGAGLGASLLGSLVGQGDTGQGGRTSGNVFTGNGAQPLSKWMDQVNQSKDVNAANTVGNATSAVQSNPLYSGLFGQNGQLQQAEGEATNLANTGYDLQPQDHEAYGQAAGNIARMFGQNDQSLSQALSDRGLSNSGVAGAAFTNSLGNKNEQLAGLQTQIAQQRMAMNQQRLNATRSFITSMGSQAQGAVGQQLANEHQRASTMNNMGMGMLGAVQGTNDDNMKQFQSTNMPGVGQSMAASLSGVGGKMMGGGAASMFGTPTTDKEDTLDMGKGGQEYYMKYGQGSVKP